MPHPILFNDQPLFAGSPGRADADAEVRVGADALRVIEQAGPGDRGVRVVGRGREARPIVQAGWLVADTQGELDARLEAIRAYLDGREYPLVDGWGRRHERGGDGAVRGRRPGAGRATGGGAVLGGVCADDSVGDGGKKDEGSL